VQKLTRAGYLNNSYFFIFKKIVIFTNNPYTMFKLIDIRLCIIIQLWNVRDIILIINLVKDAF